MMIAGIIIFCAALIGIIVLFTLKSWEMHRGEKLAPALRSQADERSLDLKAQLAQSRAHLGNIPPLLSRFGWFLVHESALGVASFAKFSERQAHNLADFVSQKHRFQRRRTRSEFLKKVSEPREKLPDQDGGQGVS